MLKASGSSLVTLYSLTPIGFDISFKAYSATNAFLLNATIRNGKLNGELNGDNGKVDGELNPALLYLNKSELAVSNIPKY